MATNKHPSRESLPIMDSCLACLHFQEVKDGRGLCTAHGRPVRAQDFRCSTHFQRSTQEVTSASA